MVRASIIIPTYNEGEYLVNTLDSIFRHTDEIKDCEFIVGDDHATDNSVKKALEKYPNLIVNRHEAGPFGTSAAKALGAEAARGNVLLFFDSHTKIESGTITKLIEGVEKTGQVVTPKIVPIDRNTWNITKGASAHGLRVEIEEIRCRWVGVNQLIHNEDLDLYESYGVPGGAMAVSRSVYDATGGWDRGLVAWGSDASFSLRICLLGHSIWHDPTAVVGHVFKKKFEQYSVSYVHILANRLRVLYSLATKDEMARYSVKWRNKYPNQFKEAQNKFKNLQITAPLLQHRLKMSLTEYKNMIKKKLKI